MIALAGLVYLLLGRATPPTDNDDSKAELFVYCAAGMRVPFEEIVGQYNQEFGTNVLPQYGGSNTLLSQLEVSKTGDLYLAADESYLQIAREKQLVAESFPVARMRAVIVAPQGNSKQVAGVDDLLREDVRVALANPDQAAMGKLTRTFMQSRGKWNELEGRVRNNGVFKPTVNDVAADVELGSVDAGIVWDAVAKQFTGVEIVRDPKLAQESTLVSIGVMRSAQSPNRALHFARYLTASDRGQTVFRKQGYEPVPSDAWSDTPQLTFYAGAVNRRALEPVIKAFEARHAVEVQTVYNGCGILTAQMEAMHDGDAGTFPDVFMACDEYYMEKVSNLFPDAVHVSDTQIVIAVEKNNPKRIATVADLVQPGMRVALGQPDQCTIGILSRRLLDARGLYDTLIEENVVTQTPTSSLLISSIATGAADAALVYLTDALAESDKVDYVEIDSRLAQAIQPLGISASSKHKQLARLLFDAVTQAQETFERVGFRWRIEPSE